MKIFFCPYIAAMWSSMKPLYDEHIANGDDVSVMALPYCTRNYDGSISEYMIDSYPVDVVSPSIGYLERVHPDRIYYHNPYDDHNTVTMVEPHFFTKKLAQCTDDLVFVPYYTHGYFDGGDLETIIRSAGVRRANHIIVYSEEQKKRYASILGEYSIDWMSKIIVKTRPAYEYDAIPDEWERIARGRKLIMLCSSVGTLINERRTALDKISAAIRDNQNDDVCIVFRPHPLYAATIKAMIPELEKQYNAIVSAFVVNEQGIFDASSDVERSAYFCDEYIGNPSSVVAFFRQHGKPIHII